MTQEIQIILTLEVDITRGKQDITDFTEKITKNISKKYFDFVKVEVKEESEIYETKVFINGFTSWQETHFEVVDYITTIRSADKLTGAIEKRQESQGIGGLYELAEEWTDEFEKLNEDREWDGEFFDEIEEFCKTKNNL